MTATLKIRAIPISGGHIYHNADGIDLGEHRMDEIRLTKLGYRFPACMIEAFDPQGRRDFEGSSCRVLRMEVLSFSMEPGFGYPTSNITGYIEEVHYATDVAEDQGDPGWAYMPPKIEWTPGLYHVQLIAKINQGD